MTHIEMISSRLRRSKTYFLQLLDKIPPFTRLPFTYELQQPHLEEQAFFRSG